MICGEGTGVFNFTSSLVLPTNSIIPYPYKFGVFPSFSDTKNFLASYVTFPSSDIFPRPPPLPLLPLTHFSWPHPLPTLILISFTRPSPLPHLPLKALPLYLTNCLNVDATYFLAYDFVLSGIEPAQRWIPFYFSSLAVMFSQYLVWHECRAEEVEFTHCGK